MLLAFTVVGYNRLAINSFVAKTATKAITEVKKPRKQRRTGTWAEIFGDPEGSGLLETVELRPEDALDMVDPSEDQ